MLKTIVAIEQDGMDVRALALSFDVPSEDFDLKAAVKAACTEYCKTPEGLETYRYNCNHFNWADFAMNVPEAICEKHGFKLVQSDISDDDVDWDEQLVNSDEIPNEEDECCGCPGCDGTNCPIGNTHCNGCEGDCSNCENATERTLS